MGLFHRVGWKPLRLLVTIHTSLNHSLNIWKKSIFWCNRIISWDGKARGMATELSLGIIIQQKMYSCWSLGSSNWSCQCHFSNSPNTVKWKKEDTCSKRSIWYEVLFWYLYVTTLLSLSQCIRSCMLFARDGFTAWFLCQTLSVGLEIFWVKGYKYEWL